MYMYNRPVPVGQESRSILDVWSCLGVSHESALWLSARAVFSQRLAWGAQALSSHTHVTSASRLTHGGLCTGLPHKLAAGSSHSL